MKIDSLPKKVIGDIAELSIENSLVRGPRFVMGSVKINSSRSSSFSRLCCA